MKTRNLPRQAVYLIGFALVIGSLALALFHRSHYQSEYLVKRIVQIARDPQFTALDTKSLKQKEIRHLLYILQQKTSEFKAEDFVDKELGKISDPYAADEVCFNIVESVLDQEPGYETPLERMGFEVLNHWWWSQMTRGGRIQNRNRVVIGMLSYLIVIAGEKHNTVAQNFYLREWQDLCQTAADDCAAKLPHLVEARRLVIDVFLKK